MEDVEILKENVKEAFKNRDNFDFSDTHLNEIIDSINYLIGKPDLYEKLEELKKKNYPDFQLACYFYQMNIWSIITITSMVNI